MNASFDFLDADGCRNPSWPMRRCKMTCSAISMSLLRAEADAQVTHKGESASTSLSTLHFGLSKHPASKPQQASSLQAHLLLLG